MKDFVWVFDFGLLRSSAGLPAELLLPTALCHVSPHELLGQTIWMVAADGSARYLFGRACAEAVAEADRPSDTLLILNDRLRSCRFLPTRAEDTEPWLLPPNYTSAAIGMHVCPPDLATRLAAMPARNKISQISPLPRGGTDQPTGRSTAAVRRRYAWLLQRFSFGDLRGNDFYRNLSPFAATLRASGDDSSAAIAELEKLDASLFTAEKEPASNVAPPIESSTLVAPVVDFFMVRFDPMAVPIRRFVATSTWDVRSDALKRTQRAEIAHQGLLVDLASFFATRGYSPLQSRSVDLALDVHGGSLLFEIKSADASNIISQAELGLVQLLRYRAAALKEDVAVLGAIVLIGFTPAQNVRDYLIRLGQEANVIYLFYNLKSSWPDRVLGLMETIRKCELSVP